jgi:hypothetical protein
MVRLHFDPRSSAPHEGSRAAVLVKNRIPRLENNAETGVVSYNLQEHSAILLSTATEEFEAPCIL